MRTLRVAIDCRIQDPRQGVWTAILALAHGLSNLNGVAQTYTFIVPEHLSDLLRPHISGACSILTIPSPRHTSARQFFRRFKVARQLAGALRATRITIPQSDGTLEKHGFDVAHFPSQIAYLTNVPSIYQPWDLQHLHYPQFFSREDLRIREKQYRAFSHQAAIVAVQTEWGKRDLIAQYGLDEGKVRIVRWGSVFEAYSPSCESDIDEARRKLELPARFIVFPAVTWPHKNHEVIIRCLAKMGAAAEPLHAVFTGATNAYQNHLLSIASAVGVLDRIHFVGFVSPRELRAIFSMAIAMVFPSKFEGLGLPILEAFHAGLPVISSNATVLPEVVGDAALLFDPDSAEELGSLLSRVLESRELRSQMIERGRQLLSSHTALNTAEHFAGLYDEIVNY